MLLVAVLEPNIKEVITNYLFTFLVLVCGLYIKNIYFLKVDLSYGIYLYSWPISQVVYFFCKNVYAGILISFIIVLCVSCFSWFYIEKPAMRYKDKFLIT